MKIALAIILLIQANNAFSAASCRLNEDCVLFLQNCQKLTAILKVELPKDYSIWDKDKIYFKSGVPDEVCVDFTASPWPKNPRAKCVKGKCKAVSKDKAN